MQGLWPYEMYKKECIEEGVKPKTPKQYITFSESYKPLVELAEKVGLVMWHNEGDNLPYWVSDPEGHEIVQFDCPPLMLAWLQGYQNGLDAARTNTTTPLDH